MYDYIFYLIAIIISIITPDYNLLLKLITLDSIYSSFDFIKSYYDKDISESQIIINNSKLYLNSFFDRLIYYALNYLFYLTVCLFLWQDDLYPIYYLLLTFTMPPVLNYILDTPPFISVFKIKEKTILTLISKQLTNVINNVSDMYICDNHDNKNNIKRLTHKELKPLLNDYKQTINYTSEIIKNIITVLMMTYMKRNYANTYYRMTKYLYSYKTGEVIQSYNIPSAKTTVINIISNRNWGEFLKPDIYNAILQLYENSLYDDKNNIVNIFVKNSKFKILKMFSIWTLSVICNDLIYIPILNIVLLLYRLDSTISVILLKILFLFIGYLISYNTNSYLITSLSTSFLYDLITSGFIKNICVSIYNKIQKNIIKIYNYNQKYFINIFLYNFLVGIIFYFIGNIYLSSIFLIKSILEINIRRDIMLVILLSSMYLSEFNLIHYLVNFVILSISYNYIYDNLLKYKNKYYNQYHSKNIKININTDVFMLPKDDFINAISVEDNTNKLTDSDIVIINNFLK